MTSQRRESASQRTRQLALRVGALALLLAAARWQLARSGPGTTTTTAAIPATTAPAASTASVAASPPPVPSPTSTVDAGEDDAANVNAPALPPDEAMHDRRTTREIIVGALPYPPTRVTWKLARGKEAAARLDVSCQVGHGSRGVLGMVLNGEEADEARWDLPIRTTYIGARTDKELTYRFTTVAVPDEVPRCLSLPKALLLACRPDKVSVLPVGAKLVLGAFTPDKAARTWWKPSARTTVAVLSCTASDESVVEASRPRQINHLEPLAFVAGAPGTPSIEWAWQNDDVVQEGAYRWMPAR